MGVVGCGREPIANELRRRAAILRTQAERLEAIAAQLEVECERSGPVLPPRPARAGKEA